MTRFYQMTYVSDAEYAPFGVAYAAAHVPALLLPPSGTRVQNWMPLTLELRDGEYADYLANDLGARLCSRRMREVVDASCTEHDDIQWLCTQVVAQDGESRPYSILHFPSDFPVLNRDHSVMAGDMPMQVVLSWQDALGHAIFTLPGEQGRRTYVAEEMRRALERDRLTGIAFLGVETTA